MEADYTPPSYKGDAFNCPHCGVFSHQDWYEVSVDRRSDEEEPQEVSLSYCDRCDGFAIWLDEDMIHPVHSEAPPPLEDMPEEVKGIYLEARGVLDASPRSSAALLRMALQRMMSYLGESSDNVSDAIMNLRNKGLDVKIQKALDSVRVTGEAAVDPGQIDIRDDREIALVLFNLVNLIVDALISQPRRVDKVVEKIPEAKEKKSKSVEMLFNSLT